MRFSNPVRLACASVFLFAALYPIAGATILTSEDVRARMVLESYRRAYPEKIRSVEWKDGDWAAVVDGKTFFWARGRLLPAEKRDSWADYKSYVFYAYPSAPSDPSTFTKARIEELRRQGEAEARLAVEDHHADFRAALFGGASRASVERKLVKAPLFGRTVSVHSMIAPAIRRVDAAVKQAAASDAEVAAFLKGISTLGGYNWREIRGTARMSYHSWGLAVDVQPKKLGRKAIYWEWERERDRDWMLVPPASRWNPPAAVVRAFEKEGFVWGGKWDFYDNMHFEYRPELHELSKVFAAAGGLDARLASMDNEAAGSGKEN
ncbi:MAG TPA: hypothetical protein DIC34_21910 [Treponema sp.]|nr:MAG: hypothetical protein A2Y36_18700 [Treponema sp. GWA1_62_8]OHE68764.1 MAG: hypothetical protein A2001_13935 [Treponema sp. GWC1_61_84]HCM29156.1 hypothetical protein [Treponema sp.]